MLLFVPMLGLLGIVIALYRRNPQRFLDGPTEDAPLRLMRWAAGLLSPQRHEWGQAMLGELDHLDGRIRRMRFALGCVGAALVLPPWGRAAAGVWAMITLAVASVGLYISVAIHYRLATGDWVAAGILTVFVTGVLLGASALVRRPGVAIPGLLGGLIVALVWLTLSGFTFYDQILPNIVPWHRLVEVIVVPFVVGAAGTVWGRDPVVGRRIARLAAITAGLGYAIWRAWTNDHRVWAGAAVGLLAAQWIATFVLRETTAHTFITFAGDGGMLVFGAALLAAFFVPPGHKLHRDWLRWGFLVIGSASFADSFYEWWSARRDPSLIAFGEIEGRGDTDPTVLLQAGWTIDRMVGRYLALGLLALGALAVLQVWHVRRTRAALDALERGEEPEDLSA